MDARVNYDPHWYRLGVVTALFFCGVTAAAVGAATFALSGARDAGTALSVTALAVMGAAIIYIAAAGAAAAVNRSRALRGRRDVAD